MHINLRPLFVLCSRGVFRESEARAAGAHRLFARGMKYVCNFERFQEKNDITDLWVLAFFGEICYYAIFAQSAP